LSAKIVSVEADWTTWTCSGRQFHSRGPAVESKRSPTVTSREEQTSRSIYDRSRLL